MWKGMLFLKKGIYRHVQEDRLKKLDLIKDQMSEERNNGFQKLKGLTKKKVSKVLSIPAVDSNYVLKFQWGCVMVLAERELRKFKDRLKKCF